MGKPSTAARQQARVEQATGLLTAAQAIQDTALRDVGSGVIEKHDGALGDRLDVRVWLRLLSCSTIIEKRLRRRFADQYATTLPRFDVLAMLERRADGATMSELSRALLVSNGNLTALVRQLEGAGLVASRPAQGDRRSLVVNLTDAGRDYFATLAVAHHRWVGRMLSGVSREDLSSLFNLLAAVKNSLADDRDEAG